MVKIPSSTIFPVVPTVFEALRLSGLLLTVPGKMAHGGHSKIDGPFSSTTDPARI